MFRSLFLVVSVLLSGCAAAELSPCERQCSPVYDSCMDAGASMSGAAALDLLHAQCSAGFSACTRACGMSASH